MKTKDDFYVALIILMIILAIITDHYMAFIPIAVIFYIETMLRK